MSHSDEDCFEKRHNQNTIKYGLGGPMESRSEAAKQYKKYKSKRKKDLKATNKQNKMLYSIANKSGSRYEIKNINKIRSKASNERRNASSDSSSDYSDFNYLLPRDRD